MPAKHKVLGSTPSGGAFFVVFDGSMRVFGALCRFLRFCIKTFMKKCNFSRPTARMYDILCIAGIREKALRAWTKIRKGTTLIAGCPSLFSSGLALLIVSAASAFFSLLLSCFALLPFRSAVAIADEP